VSAGSFDLPPLPPPYVAAEVRARPAVSGASRDLPLLPDDESSQAKQGLLRRPLETEPAPSVAPFFPEPETLFVTEMDPPLGYTGQSGILPSESQESSHFVPVEDRWRLGMPAWDRYGSGHPFDDDYPYVLGRKLDPFTQNVLKGDYPIIGQHTFLDVTATSSAFIEPRQVPTATTPFESTARPFEQNFFGRPNQLFYTNYFSLSFDLFSGDAAFKPVDWRIKLVPTFNVNNLRSRSSRS